MTSIKLMLTGAQAWASVNGPLTSGMVGIPVTIEYDEAWDGLTKNLMCRCSPWRSNDGEIRTILNVGETAAVAHEVMQAGMYLHLGVEGFSSDGKLVIPTTWARCGKIEYGANTGEDPSADPELPIWNQLQAEIEQIKHDGITPEQMGEIQTCVQSATQAAARAERAEVNATAASNLAVSNANLAETFEKQAQTYANNASTSAGSAANLANGALQAQRAAEAAAQRAEAAADSGDYTTLTNKPKINGVEVSGDKTAEDYGIGQPSDEQIGAAVGAWLTEHPEATTTVQDGSITAAKLAPALRLPLVGDYSGFKAVFLGDSNTAVNVNKSKPWWQWVVELLGITSYVNYGTNGATLSFLGAEGKRMCEMYENMDDDASLIFVMGGVNEFRADTQTPFGTTADTVPATISGAVRYICRGLQRKYPGKPVVFITPTNQTLWTHSEGKTMADLSRAIMDACHMEGVLCLDAQGNLGINPAGESLYTSDRLHLNDLGSELLGRWVANQVVVNVPILGNAPSGETPEEPEPEKTLTGISAAYSGGSVPVGTAVSALTGVVVTAHYSDGTSAAVTGYTLSGTIAEGSNTITVSYGGKTATFAVTGVADEEPEAPAETVTLNLADYSVTEGKYINKTGQAQTGGGWKYTEKIPVPSGTDVTVCVESRLNPAYYDADQNFISAGDFGDASIGGPTQGTPKEFTVTTPENCAYIVINISPNTDDRSVLWIKYEK